MNTDKVRERILNIVANQDPEIVEMPDDVVCAITDEILADPDIKKRLELLEEHNSSFHNWIKKVA